MLAVGGAHTRAGRHVSPDAMLAHYPLDPLAADTLARGTQFGVDFRRLRLVGDGGRLYPRLSGVAYDPECDCREAAASVQGRLQRPALRGVTDPAGGLLVFALFPELSRHRGAV